MNEYFDEEESQQPQGEPSVSAMLKKMQQQLVYLEKKIDILIQQSAGRPSKERHFSPHSGPSRFGHSHSGHHREKRRERNFSDRPSFGDRPPRDERGFGDRPPRDDRSGGFDRERKPFFRRKHR